MFFYIVKMILIQLAVAAVWILIITKMDKYRKVKKTGKAPVLLYIVGLSSVLVSAGLYRIMPDFLLASDNYVIENFVTNMLLVGPSEEFCKFLVFLIVVKSLKSIREPMDGILQAATVGLAFASVENVMYSLWYGPYVVSYRSIFVVAGHMVDASIWGLSYALISMRPKRRLGYVPIERYVFAVICAGFAHGLYNWLLLFDIGYALLLDMALIFLVLVIYVYALERSPFRQAGPREYRKTIPSILLSLNANPTDMRLNFRLSLNYIYARKYPAALVTLDRCLERKPESCVLTALKGVVQLLQNQFALGKRTLGGALNCMDERQLRAFDKLCRRYVRSHVPQLTIRGMIAMKLENGIKIVYVTERVSSMAMR